MCKRKRVHLSIRLSYAQFAFRQAHLRPPLCERSSPLGKRKHESEDSSDKKGKKKVRIAEDKDEEEKVEEVEEEEEEAGEKVEEQVEVEEAAALGEVLLPNFSLFMPIGMAHQQTRDGSSSPISIPSPPQLLTPPQLLSPPPSPPRASTTRRGPLLRRNETML
ncbi:hypothetical protein BDF14DRAFT_1880406 [Spinellus fusiger]|nr:hypothetical protein BDF14DRAFT_1880406 [Spinellus fusiger]